MKLKILTFLLFCVLAGCTADYAGKGVVVRQGKPIHYGGFAEIDCGGTVWVHLTHSAASAPDWAHDPRWYYRPFQVRCDYTEYSVGDSVHVFTSHEPPDLDAYVKPHVGGYR